MSQEARVKLGVIGCGRVAQLAHLGVLARLTGVEVTAIADTDEGRREQARAVVPRAAQCVDSSHLLDRHDVDGVVICLPPALHAPAAIEAFRASKHVYLEKPIALNLTEASAVCDAWKQSGKIGMIGFNFRYNELYRALRAHVEAGTIGEIVAARSIFSAAARPLPPWKRTRASGGGVLLDLVSHVADISRYLLGEEILMARAAVRSQRCEQDTALVEMRTASGILVSSLASMSAIEEHRYEIFGVRGKLSMDRLEAQVQTTRPTMPYDRIRRVWDSCLALSPKRLMRDPSEPSFATALAAFAEAVRLNRAVQPDLDDGFRSLAIVHAAEESLERDCLVEVPTARTAPARLR